MVAGRLPRRRSVSAAGEAQPRWVRDLVSAQPYGLGLSAISCSSAVVLNRLHLVLRDQNWRTIEPYALDVDVDHGASASTMSVRARYRDGGIVLDLTTSFSLDAHTVRASFRGVFESDCEVNRLGFCLLHPLRLCGVAVDARRPDGIERRSFPRQATPGAIFEDLVGMSYQSDGVSVDLSMTGDLFETEDQRNWTDASFKTFSTPLRLPRPRRVASGDVIEQSITIGVRSHRDVKVVREPRTSVIRVLDQLPTVMPPIGSVYLPSGFAEPMTKLARPPAFWWAEIDLRGDWRHQVSECARRASIDGVSLDIVFVCGVGELGTLSDAIGHLARLRPRANLRCVAAFERWRWVSTPDVIRILHAVLAAHGLSADTLGGSLADYSELVRNTDSLRGADAVTFSMNPQVHARDDLSVFETLQVQPHLVEAAAALAAGRPMELGPITFEPRFNAAALAHDGPIFTQSSDARITTRLAAAWTVGSLASVIGHTRALVYHRYGEINADLPIASPDHTTPLASVLDLVRSIEGWSLRETAAGAGIAAIFAHRAGSWLLICANLSPRPQEIQLDPELAATEVAALDAQGGFTPVAHADPAATIRLDAYQIVTCRGRRS